MAYAAKNEKLPADAFISRISNATVTQSDIRLIENEIIIFAASNRYEQYHSMVNNLSLILELLVALLDKKEKMTLLEVVYKFEGIIRSDIVSHVIKTGTTFHAVLQCFKDNRENCSDAMQEIILQRCALLSDLDPDSITLTVEHKHEQAKSEPFTALKIINELSIPLYSSGEVIGILQFFNLLYNRGKHYER